MNKTLDIVKLIQDNPLMRLNDSTYESRLVNKIKERFSNEEQQLFVTNFWCYLNCNPKEYVIDLDNIWKWIGFGKKSDCKNLLVNNFEKNEDYVIFKDHEKAAAEFAAAGSQAKKSKNLGGAGLNKETILLTIRCFKKLCLKAKTKNSSKVHDYYVNLEEIMNEEIKEQGQDLINKLKIKDKEIELKDKEIEDKEKQLEEKDRQLIINREKTLLENHGNSIGVYLGFAGKDIIKFGRGKIKDRVSAHKNEIGSHFTLEYVIETQYDRELEYLIKKHLKNKIFEKDFPNRRSLCTELIRLDSTFTIKDLYNEVIRLKEQVKDVVIEEQQKEIEALKEELTNISNNQVSKELKEIKTSINNIRKTDKELEYQRQHDPKKIKTLFVVTKNEEDRLDTDTIYDICRKNGITTSSAKIYTVIEEMGCLKYKSGNIRGFKYIALTEDNNEELADDELKQKNKEKNKEKKKSIIEQKTEKQNIIFEKIKLLFEITTNENDVISSKEVWKICKENGINLGYNKIGPYLSELGTEYCRTGKDKLRSFKFLKLK